jgi:phage FluMu protein Com
MEIPCPECKTLITFRHNTYCKKCKKFWSHKAFQVKERKEHLTTDEKADYAMEALVNWTINTEEHLNQARFLKSERKRLPQEGHKTRRWWTGIGFLWEKIFKELCVAEPDTVETMGGCLPFIDRNAYLDNIPEFEAANVRKLETRFGTRKIPATKPKSRHKRSKV